MPPQTQPNLSSTSEPDTAQERSSRVSRRSLLRGAGVVGVAGVAAGGAGAVVALVQKPDTTLMPTDKPVAMSAMPPNAMDGPMVVYLADTTTGEMDVFAGTGQIRLRNPAMVGQLMRNLRMAQ